MERGTWSWFAHALLRVTRVESDVCVARFCSSNAAVPHRLFCQLVTKLLWRRASGTESVCTNRATEQFSGFSKMEGPVVPGPPSSN